MSGQQPTAAKVTQFQDATLCCLSGTTAQKPGGDVTATVDVKIFFRPKFRSKGRGSLSMSGIGYQQESSLKSCNKPRAGERRAKTKKAAIRALFHGVSVYPRGFHGFRSKHL